MLAKVLEKGGALGQMTYMVAPLVRVSELGMKL